jgi:hypothetical protein
MNSITSEVLFCSPVAAHQLSLHYTAARETFEEGVAAAILAAALTGVFIATVSTSSVSSKDLQFVMGLLNQAGYQAAVTGTSLSISW